MRKASSPIGIWANAEVTEQGLLMPKLTSRRRKSNPPLRYSPPTPMRKKKRTVYKRKRKSTSNSDALKRSKEVSKKRSSSRVRRSSAPHSSSTPRGTRRRGTDKRGKRNPCDGDTPPPRYHPRNACVALSTFNPSIDGGVTGRHHREKLMFRIGPAYTFGDLLRDVSDHWGLKQSNHQLLGPNGEVLPPSLPIDREDLVEGTRNTPYLLVPKWKASERGKGEKRWKQGQEIAQFPFEEKEDVREDVCEDIREDVCEDAREDVLENVREDVYEDVLEDDTDGLRDDSEIGMMEPAETSLSVDFTRDDLEADTNASDGDGGDGYHTSTPHTAITTAPHAMVESNAGGVTAIDPITHSMEPTDGVITPSDPITHSMEPTDPITHSMEPTDSSTHSMEATDAAMGPNESAPNGHDHSPHTPPRVSKRNTVICSTEPPHRSPSVQERFGLYILGQGGVLIEQNTTGLQLRNKRICEIEGRFGYTDTGDVFEVYATNSSTILQRGMIWKPVSVPEERSLVQMAQMNVFCGRREEQRDGDGQKKVRLAVPRKGGGVLQWDATDVCFFPSTRVLLPKCHVVELSCGSTHAVVVSTDGQMFTWGYGEYGQLGLGTSATHVPSPTRVSGALQSLMKPSRLFPAAHMGAVESMPVVLAVSAGLKHTLCLTSGGIIYAFGCGAQGRLGLGTTDDVFLPCPLQPLKPCSVDDSSDDGKDSNTCIRVYAGESHSAALTDGGMLYTWGNGKFGQLGHCNQRDCTTPTMVESLSHTRVVMAALEALHTAVLTVDGNVYTFGFRMAPSRPIDDPSAAGFSPGMLVSAPRLAICDKQVVQIATSSDFGVLIALCGKIVGKADAPIRL